MLLFFIFFVRVLFLKLGLDSKNYFDKLYNNYLKTCLKKLEHGYLCDGQRS
jgi:hypothetical protein